jgi:hypothetical protein
MPSQEHTVTTLQVVFEQRTPISHLLQLCFCVDCTPFVFGLFRVLLVDPRKQELEREGAHHASSSERERRAKSSRILWRFLLLEDEGADDASQITDTNHGGNTGPC